MKSRVGRVESVVIFGGEPTLHSDLGDVLQRIRELGFKTKLDTNGSLPERLVPLFEKGLLDFVAMDIKSAPETYQRLVGVSVDLEKIKTSVDLIKGSGIPYEFRMTRVPHLHLESDYERARELVGPDDEIRFQDYVAHG